MNKLYLRNQKYKHNWRECQKLENLLSNNYWIYFLGREYHQSVTLLNPAPSSSIIYLCFVVKYFHGVVHGGCNGSIQERC